MAEMTIQDRAGQVLSLAAGYAGARTIEIGLRTGLLEAAAARPNGFRPDELAKEAGLDPFYVGVWCRSAYGAEVLDLAGEETYTLAAHVATILLDQDSPAYAGALFTVLEQPELFDRFAEVLPTGERTWWDQTGPGWIQGVSGTGRAFYNRLIPGGLERVPGLTTKLNEGARVLELASGAGIGLVKLADAYPDITLVGVDGDTFSLDLARERVQDAGIAERVELVRSTLEDYDAADEFDVALINISMHEARDLDRVTQNVREALVPGGVFVISDFPFPESHDGFRTIPGRLMLAIQFFEAMIDDQLLPTRAFVDLLERHGFSDVGHVDLTPVHALSYGRA